MERIIIILTCLICFCSCADEKYFYFKNGKEISEKDFDIYMNTESHLKTDTVLSYLVKPYGWANWESTKDENVIYDVVIGNIVWSIILSETIVVPIYFTG